jgi:predicted restriction endonuclease
MIVPDGEDGSVQEHKAVAALMAALNKLQVDRSSGKPARHQPLTLLWAFGRAVKGEPRLVSWSEAKDELRPLLQKYGRPGSDPAPEYPFVALHRSPLWELKDVQGEVPPARGSGLRRWIDSQEKLKGGLKASVEELVATVGVAREGAVDLLYERFFSDEVDRDALLRDVRLDGPIFDGFGPVPGFEVGEVFRDRIALAKSRMHRQRQGGISGRQNVGAESIVVSGGYEDDEDLGDVIIYTGQGGRDERTGKQVRDQELTLGNAALVTSMTNGTPVRVIRGAKARSAYSPTSGLRYDGLFRVEEYWSEIGQSGFLVWRYRLRKVDSPQPAEIPPPRLPRQPTGNESPGRVTTTTQRIVRSTAIAQFVKMAHDYTCQVCGTRLETPAGAYAECAHIRPLGRPHFGPDTQENVLCLCPNHHVLFDVGMLSIADDLTVTDYSTTSGPARRLREVPGHDIGREYLAYHRDHYRGVRQAAVR